ncbi:MAG: ArsC/Spx/MgsR family protein [Candidatus Puniceispirillales bacterium]
MCSKSRQTLELLKLKTNNYIIIEYLKIRINKENLKESLKYLDVPIHNVIRDNEITFKKMKVNKIEFSANEILELIIQSPMLLQRPLVTKYVNNKAVMSIISRPPEKISSL